MKKQLEDGGAWPALSKHIIAIQHIYADMVAANDEENYTRTHKASYQSGILYTIITVCRKWIIRPKRTATATVTQPSPIVFLASTPPPPPPPPSLFQIILFYTWLPCTFCFVISNCAILADGSSISVTLPRTSSLTEGKACTLTQHCQQSAPCPAVWCCVPPLCSLFCNQSKPALQLLWNSFIESACLCVWVPMCVCVCACMGLE